MHNQGSIVQKALFSHDKYDALNVPLGAYNSCPSCARLTATRVVGATDSVVCAHFPCAIANRQRICVVFAPQPFRHLSLLQVTIKTNCLKSSKSVQNQHEFLILPMNYIDENGEQSAGLIIDVKDDTNSKSGLNFVKSERWFDNFAGVSMQ